MRTSVCQRCSELLFLLLCPIHYITSLHARRGLLPLHTNSFSITQQAPPVYRLHINQFKHSVSAKSCQLQRSKTCIPGWIFLCFDTCLVVTLFFGFALCPLPLFWLWSWIVSWIFINEPPAHGLPCPLHPHPSLVSVQASKFHQWL